MRGSPRRRRIGTMAVERGPTGPGRMHAPPPPTAGRWSRFNGSPRLRPAHGPWDERRGGRSPDLRVVRFRPRLPRPMAQWRRLRGWTLPSPLTVAGTAAELEPEPRTAFPLGPAFARTACRQSSPFPWAHATDGSRRAQAWAPASSVFSDARSPGTRSIPSARLYWARASPGRPSRTSACPQRR